MSATLFIYFDGLPLIGSTVIVKIAGPSNLSSQVCSQLASLGLYISPSTTIARNFLFNGPVNIKPQTTLYRVQIDAYSYIMPQSTVVTTKVGRYCSIGHQVDLGLGYHNYKVASTSSAFYPFELFPGINDKITYMPEWLKERNYQNTAQVTIGNDVWVGAHALIPGDVTIGHGAVIGAGAVITKDVPPYAVVSGSSNGKPKIQKYRFSDEVISDLLELNWWDYDLPKMMAQGIKVPYENVKDFISFMKNEDLSKFLMIPNNWRLLSIINENRVQLTPGQKDMFMDFIQIELPDIE